MGCDIYVLEATAQVTIDDCVDCRIVLGPCAGSLFLRDSSKCVVMAACQQYRTRGCTDLGMFTRAFVVVVASHIPEALHTLHPFQNRQTDVRLYAATAPSIESSHSIRFGCYTCAYTRWGKRPRYRLSHVTQHKPPTHMHACTSTFSLAAQFAAAGLDPKGDNRWWDVYDFTPSAAIAVDDDGGTKPHFSIMAGDATHAPDVKVRHVRIGGRRLLA